MNANQEMGQKNESQEERRGEGRKDTKHGRDMEAAAVTEMPFPLVLSHNYKFGKFWLSNN